MRPARQPCYGSGNPPSPQYLERNESGIRIWEVPESRILPRLPELTSGRARAKALDGQGTHDNISLDGTTG
jgi:hypothetical protein